VSHVFPGQYFDEETGLHYNYFRDYDPTTGRYLQPDPLGTTAGLNLYAYVAGNPIIRVDRNGLAWECTCRANAQGGVPQGYAAKLCRYECECMCTTTFSRFFPFFKDDISFRSLTRRYGTGFDAGSLICHGQSGTTKPDRNGTVSPNMESFFVSSTSSTSRNEYPDVYREIDQRLECGCEK
jgi:RHS repeat-associated protein